MGIIMPKWIKNIFKGSDKEKEYTWWELVHKEAAEGCRYELEKVNLPIRMRNRARERKKEFEKLAMELFKNPESVNEVAKKICESVRKTEGMNDEEYFALKDAIIEMIIIPLEENGKIVDAKTMRRSCGYFIPLLQDKNLIKPTENVKIIDEI